MITDIILRGFVCCLLSFAGCGSGWSGQSAARLSPFRCGEGMGSSACRHPGEGASTQD